MTYPIFSATLVSALTLLGAATALAQSSPTPPPDTPREAEVVADVQTDTLIAVPAFATPNDVATGANMTTSAMARQIASVIAADLDRSGLYRTAGPMGLATPSMAQVTPPVFGLWSGVNAEALVTGFVRTDSAGNLAIGCYLTDVSLKSELVRQGYVVPAADWRRAAHKCADAIYARLSGESPFFDSRVAYIAESGPKGNRMKRLAIMDSDGANHRFITTGQSLALTPRFSPDYKRIAYVSYLGSRARVYVYDIATGKQTVVSDTTNPTFAPRWSPDGKSLLFAMAANGNTDIFLAPASGGTPRRMTDSPGIDVGGSFSPDGRRIVFESDRSGSQQLYVMNADGSDQRRITFGAGRYATPEWSPRGDLIAFTRVSGNFRIGVMTPQGSNERLLTDDWQDEAPSWSPNGRVIQFFRTSAGRDGRSSIWQVDLTGVNLRRLPTPVDGSDPAWGPVLP